MVRKELLDFKMNIAGESVDCRPPFSVYTVASGAKISTRGATSATFTTNLYADSVAISSKHAFILVTETPLRYEVRLNGERIGESDGESENSYFELTGKLLSGNNELSFVFFGEDVLPLGIYGKVEFIRTSGALIDKLYVTERIEGDSAELGITITTVGSADGVRAVATLVSSAGQVYYGGLIRGRGKITVKNPLIWWPRGLGVQNLYKLTVNLYGESEIEDTREVRVGIRKISSVITPSSSKLEVGGASLLPMGAVYRFDAERDPRVAKKKLKAAISAAAAANFNTIVLPLGAKEPPEEFYTDCDLYGIAVIREIDGSDDKIFEHLATLSHHPSLAFIDFIGGERAELIADRMQSVLPSRDFAFFDESPAYLKTASFSSPKTAEQMLSSGERNLFSEKMESLAGGEIIGILEKISKNYLYPRDIHEFSYLSWLVASDELCESVKQARLSSGAFGRAIFDGIGAYSGLVSGSSMDSHARWKGSHYAAMRCFSPVVAFAEREGNIVGFSVSNERKTDFIGELEYRILDCKNRMIFKESVPFAIDASSARKLFTKDFSEIVSGRENEYYLEYVLRDGMSVSYRDTLLFVADKSFSYLDPNIRAEVLGHDRRYTVTLSADSYARRVMIDFSGADVILSQNCFDVTQNTPVKVSFMLVNGEDSAETLAASLKITSLYDIGK